ncbi:MAG: cupin domain-containing protein [Azospirillaceae bacterium]|nr:cupin domain-containing protein [Azospirillaceae bacterium]
MDSTTPPADGSLARRPTTANSWYSPIGLAISFLISGDETQGQFSQLQITARHGAGPARHVHSREDETLTVLAGAVVVQVGDATTTLHPGDTVFLPRGVPHTYQVITPQATFLGTIGPAGFENFFRTIAEPAVAPGLPDGPSVAPDPQRIAALLGGFGVTVVGPPLRLDGVRFTPAKPLT